MPPESPPPSPAEYALAARKADSDSRSSIESDRARNEWTPVPISQLGPAEPPDWLWEGYIARGHITLFSGLWKSGKSTLIGYLFRDMGQGGGLVGQPVKGKILVISEESGSIWARRREDLELGDNVELICRPFLTKPTPAEWERRMRELSELVRRRGYALVVFDTLSSMWPVTNENDAAEVSAALMPLHGITKHNCGVLVTHHPKKGDADQAQASRGSGALPGFVDVIVEMRRHAPEEPSDCRRELKGYGRLEDVPAQQLIELGEGGYRVLGSKSQVRDEDINRIIRQLLPTEGEGLTGEQVLAGWPEHPKPGSRTVQRALKAGATPDGDLERLGSGHKGGAFRYRRKAGFDSRTVHLLRAGNESEPSSGLAAASVAGPESSRSDLEACRPMEVPPAFVAPSRDAGGH